MSKKPEGYDFIFPDTKEKMEKTIKIQAIIEEAYKKIIETIGKK